MLTLTISSLLLLGASAQEFGLPVSGPNDFGPSSTPEETQLFETAGRQPYYSDYVPFNRIYNGTQESWAWRVNMSEVGVPNSRDGVQGLGDPNANYSRTRRALNTQWQIDWPDNTTFGTFEEYLTDRNCNLTLRVSMRSWPSNITEGYNAEDLGNCASILGEQCVEGLVGLRSQDEISRTPGCENTLGVTLNNPVISTGGSYSLTANSNTTVPLTQGRPWYYAVSDIYTDNTGDDTILNATRAALQVFILSLDNNLGQGPFGQTDRNTVICRIMEPNAASFAEDGSIGSGSEETMPSAAGRLGMEGVAFAAALVVGAVAFVL